MPETSVVIVCAQCRTFWARGDEQSGCVDPSLACLAVLSGVPHGEAVAWVRATYCVEAVETAEQAAFVAGLAGGGTSTG